MIVQNRSFSAAAVALLRLSARDWPWPWVWLLACATVLGSSLFFITGLGFLPIAEASATGFVARLFGRQIGVVEQRSRLRPGHQPSGCVVGPVGEALADGRQPRLVPQPAQRNADEFSPEGIRHAPPDEPRRPRRGSPWPAPGWW